MHFLIFLIFIAVIAYLFWWQFKSNSNEAPEEYTQPVSNTDLPNLRPCFISDGRLYYQENNKIENIESQYVQELLARLERDKKQAGWKEGTTWDTSFAQMRGMGERGEEDSEIRFVSVSHLNSTTLLYFLKSLDFGGLFKYDLEEKKEVRLLHRQHLNYQDLSAPNDEGLVLFSAFQAGENSNIAMIDSDGNQYRELTAGDTIDTNPAWVANKKNEIVYQSQGLARSQEGYIKGVGPASINLLNIEKGDLETIFADDEFDYLKPQVSESGNLYFIKRPYEAPQWSQGNVLLDALMFPFRLLRAVFHYLNFFSLMYSKKPLTSAGGPQLNEDAKTIIVRGKRIQTEKALKSLKPIQGAPSLVPSSWQLIKCDSQGNRTILASHVTSFCINKSEEIIYSNGCGIFYINESQAPVKILQENLIEEVYH